MKSKTKFRMPCTPRAIANDPFTRNRVVSEIKKRVQMFIDETGREPSWQDFNSTPWLPSSRYIQRTFGGLKVLRSELGLSVTDYSSGKVRTKTAKAAMKRASRYEKQIYDALYEKHHDHKTFTKVVDREVPYQKYDLEADVWSNVRSDIVIDDRQNNHVHFFDLFFAKDMPSLGGSLGCKRRKLQKTPVKLPPETTWSVAFVSMNPDISQEMIDSRRINTDGYRVMAYDTFVAEWLS